MNKILFILLFVSCLMSSCSKYGLTDYYGYEISFETCDSLLLVRYDNDTCLFKDFKAKSQFLSLLYVDEQCDVCYVKFMEYARHSNTLPKSERLNYLIIFRGKDFHVFAKKSLRNLPMFECYVLIDSYQKFLTANANVPREYIDMGLLIDNKNRIQLFGEPHNNIKMEHLYNKIINDN